MTPDRKRTLADLARRLDNPNVEHTTCPNCGAAAIRYSLGIACEHGHIYGDLASQLVPSIDATSDAVGLLVQLASVTKRG